MTFRLTDYELGYLTALVIKVTRIGVTPTESQRTYGMAYKWATECLT